MIFGQNDYFLPRKPEVTHKLHNILSTQREGAGGAGGAPGCCASLGGLLLRGARACMAVRYLHGPMQACTRFDAAQNLHGPGQEGTLTQMATLTCTESWVAHSQGETEDTQGIEEPLLFNYLTTALHVVVR